MPSSEPKTYKPVLPNAVILFVAWVAVLGGMDRWLAGGPLLVWGPVAVGGYLLSRYRITVTEPSVEEEEGEEEEEEEREEPPKGRKRNSSRGE